MTRIPRLLVLLALTLGGVAGCREDGPLVQPSPIDDGHSPFQYPVALWDRGIEGETLLLVHVTEAGGVDSAVVAHSSGRMAFDSAATAGAFRLRFVPGHRAGERIAMWVKLPVRFSRDTAAADSVP